MGGTQQEGNSFLEEKEVYQSEIVGKISHRFLCRTLKYQKKFYMVNKYFSVLSEARKVSSAKKYFGSYKENLAL